MIRQNELMNVRCSERGSLLEIKIYSPSSECLIECVDIPEHSGPSSRIVVCVSRVPELLNVSKEQKGVPYG